MIGASALAFSLATPGVALASGECGPPNAAADPNLASCIGDPNEYANGITYNQGSYATPAGILIDLYSTITVAPTTNGTAVAAIGSPDHAAPIPARTGSTITATGPGPLAQASGQAGAPIANPGHVTTRNQATEQNAV